MTRIEPKLTVQDVARNDYPRQVTARCGCSVKAWNQRAADRLRDGSCINCTCEEMRAHALRDRRPFRDRSQ